MEINGKYINFTGGAGYIEGDRGSSFPKEYTWIQCSDFHEKCCICLSCALIPFGGITFKGCFAVIYYKNKEFRLATYLGAKVTNDDKNSLIIEQGRYRLEAYMKTSDSCYLLAPHKGGMSRKIKECATCPAIFKIYKDDKPVLILKSDNASYERVEN